MLLPASEFLQPHGGVAALRDTLGRRAGKLPERLAADFERFAASGPESRALNVGDAAEVWAPLLAPASGLDHVAEDTLLVVDEPGDVAEAAEFLWRQADERRAELIEAGDLPKDWPSTYVGPRPWKSRLVASRTLELTWESEQPESAALAARGLSSGDMFGWREPVLPAGRGAAIGSAVEAWQRDGGRIVLASDQAPRLAELLDEAGHPAAVRPHARGAAAGRRRPHRAQPERRLRGRPGRPRLRHRPGAVRDRPRPPPEGPPARRPARHPRAAHAGRPRRPHRPRRVALRADAPPRQQGRRRGPRLPRAELLGRRQDLRPGRADQPDLALLRRRAPLALEAGRHRVAPDEAARPQGGHRPRRRAARALRLPVARPGRRVHAGHAVAVGDGGELPVRGDARPGPGGRRGQGRHGGRPADGPARRRRRRLRQDRGRPAGGVQGDPGRQAGRGARPDDGPRGAALRDVRPALRRVPGPGPAAVAVRQPDRAEADDRRPRGRLGRPRDRDAPAALEGRPVPRPGPRRRRRGAAVRRRGEGAAQAAPARGRRPDALGHADPADAEPRPRRRPRHERDRDAAGGPPADPDPGRGGVGGPRPRRDPARARSRRPGVLRPQPGRDDRGPDRAAPADAARRPVRRRPRPDARGPSRERDDQVRRRRGRRPRLHDDHRVRASTSPTRTRSSSTAPTRSGSPSSTSCGAGSGARRAGPTPTCSTGGASG